MNDKSMDNTTSKEIEIQPISPSSSPLNQKHMPSKHDKHRKHYNSYDIDGKLLPIVNGKKSIRAKPNQRKCIVSIHPRKSKEWWREYRLNNLDKLRDYKRKYDREMYVINGARENARRKAWREANPIKYKAQMKLNAAVQNGLVEKKPCVVCGASKVHGHHEDYSKPLDVIWVCSIHHSELTRKARIAGCAVYPL